MAQGNIAPRMCEKSHEMGQKGLNSARPAADARSGFGHGTSQNQGFTRSNPYHRPQAPATVIRPALSLAC